jgi:type IV pilus assembly protein PilN
VAFSVIALVLGGVVVGSVQLAIDAQIEYQNRRNQYLKDETLKLDAQIAEINKLRAEIQGLLARKNVVEGLQSARSDVVHLMDQMLRILPDGVYLKSLKQTGRNIDLVGYAQSSARVSTLIRAIEDSPWLDTPILIQIQATAVNNKRSNEFSLKLHLTELKDGVGEPPNKKAGISPAVKK